MDLPGSDETKQAHYVAAMDRISPEARSQNMSRVRGKDTKPEIAVRKLLHARGYRFRLQRRDLPGKPDIVLPRYHTAVFVHGCFWHGHEGCKRAALPSTRTEFWSEKISKNAVRDRRTIEELDKLGFRSVIIWQCELRQPDAVMQRIDQVTGRVQ